MNRGGKKKWGGKRKPFSQGRKAGRPPERHVKTSRPGWLWTGSQFLSLQGQVFWWASKKAWFGRLREMKRPPRGYDWHSFTNVGLERVRQGFSHPREAMAWVEDHFKRRDRTKGWQSVLK